MKTIGFLGFGKIGRALFDEAVKKKLAKPVYIQNIVPVEGVEESVKIIAGYDEEAYSEADLVIECATADALKENIEDILRFSDLMMFSVTAFSDEEFEKKAMELAEKYKRHIYIPHGAILGLDGIMDGSVIWDEVSIVTTKNPHSLGRDDTEKTVVYKGSTRGACRAYPRNVNVHAAVALTGIGFDRTQSEIVSDPAVNSNTHIISLKGAGVQMQIQVSSFSEGGVTGKYTPLSACGSLARILSDDVIKIV